MQNSSKLKLLLLISLILGFNPLMGCSESKTEAETIVIKMSEFAPEVIQDVKHNLPAVLCSKGEFIHACFKVSQEKCNEQNQIFVSQCANDLETKLVKSKDSFKCSSKEDCSAKGSDLGKAIGQQIGSCAGSKFELANPGTLKKQSCIEFLKSKGLDTSAIEKNYP